MFKKDNFKTKISFVLTVLFFIALAFSSFSNSVDASTPVFNNHANDHKTLRLKNRTTGTPSWTTPISASPGDYVSFDVYYHNNTVGTTATNTRVRIDYPCSSNSTIIPTAYIMANNASTVSDTARINVSGTPQKLIFDSVAKWYPNQTTVPTNISVTQVGPCSVEVNIGSIQGCWEYQGHVVFDARLTEDDPDPSADLRCHTSTDDSITLSYNTYDASNASIFRGSARLTILGSGTRSGTYRDTGLSSDTSYTYYLRNGTSSSSTQLARVRCSTDDIEDEGRILVSKTVKSLERSGIYVDSLNAFPGELVNYSIKVTARDGVARDVVVKDSLSPTRLVHAGNLRVDGIRVSGDIEEGIDIGDIDEGDSKTVTFDVRIASRDNFVIGTTSFTNTAVVTSENDRATDTAVVHVRRDQPVGPPTIVPTGITGNGFLDYVVLPFLLTIIIFVLFRKHFINLVRKLETTRREVRAEW